jgi:hypothetical protein
MRTLHGGPIPRCACITGYSQRPRTRTLHPAAFSFASPCSMTSLCACADSWLVPSIQVRISVGLWHHARESEPAGGNIDKA